MHPSRFHFFNCCALGRVDSSEERNNGLFHMAALCEESVKLASREKTAAKDGTRPNACLLLGSERRAVGGREGERERARREKREQGSQAVLEFCQSLVWSVCSRIQETKHAKKGHKYYQSFINQQAGFSKQTPCNCTTKQYVKKKQFS